MRFHRTGRATGLARTLFALVALAGAQLAACSRGDEAARFAPAPAGDPRPDLVLVVFDRLDADMARTGEIAAAMPTLARFARQSESWTRVYAASGAADSAMAAMLTGLSPQTIGSVQDWTTVQGWTVAPTPEIQTFPRLLRAAGYHTIRIGSRLDAFGGHAAPWTEDQRAADAEWFTLPARGPVYMQVEIGVDAAVSKTGGGGLFGLGKGSDEAAGSTLAVRPPAYLPDTPKMRGALVEERRGLAAADARLARLLQRIERSGLGANAIIVVTARIGPARPRAERTLYDSGVHTPLWIRWPKGARAGATRGEPASALDLAPSMLALAGVRAPGWMQGTTRFAPGGTGGRYAFSFQGRVDSTFERAFSVRDGRFALIVNLAPDTPLIALARPNAAREAFLLAKGAGRLSPGQARTAAARRPSHELYDLQSDPDCLRDLAGDPGRAADVRRLGAALNAFALSAPDLSTWSRAELRDLFKPGGETPMTTAPTASVRAGRLALDSLTPGAAVLWRKKDSEPWRIYSTPFALPKSDQIRAFASRPGYRDSPIVTLPARS